MESRKSPLHPAIEFLIVIGLTYGLMIYSELELVFHPHAFQDYFTNGQLLSLVVYELFVGGLAVAVLWFNGHKVSDHKAEFTARTVLDSLLLLMASMLAASVLDYLVLFAAGPDRMQPATSLPSSLSPRVVLLVSLVNPVFEEGILLAYVVRVLRSQGLPIALGVSLLLRLVTHLYQGPPAATQILPIGLVFSGYYWVTRKIWPPVLAHALLDFIGLI